MSRDVGVRIGASRLVLRRTIRTIMMVVKSCRQSAGQKVGQRQSCSQQSQPKPRQAGQMSLSGKLTSFLERQLSWDDVASAVKPRIRLIRTNPTPAAKQDIAVDTNTFASGSIFQERPMRRTVSVSAGLRNVGKVDPDRHPLSGNFSANPPPEKVGHSSESAVSQEGVVCRSSFRVGTLVFHGRFRDSCGLGMHLRRTP